MAQYAIRRGNPAAEVFVGDGRVTNLGPGTIYYADNQDVTPTFYEGTLASGATTALEGVQWFTTDAPRASLYVVPGQTTIGQGPAGPPGAPGPQGPGGADAVENSDALRGESGRYARFVTGALRYTGTGWDLVNDSFSRPTNVDSVVSDENKITIHHETISALHVGNLVPTPNEDLAAVGIRAIPKHGIAATDLVLRQDRLLTDFAVWSGTAWVLSKGSLSPFQLSGLDGGSDDYPATVQAEAGLQAYHRFSDASGAVIQDELVGNHDGVVVSTGTTYAITSGAPVISDATPDKAMKVATGGTNEFTFALMGLMTQAAFSVELWIKVPTGGTALIRDQAVSTTQGYWIGKQIATGLLMYRMGTGTVQVTAYPWASIENTYRHIVWTKNGATGKLYIDGVLVHSSTGQPTTALQSPWHIGRGGYAATTQDSQAVEVSEAAWYNVEVPAASVKEHYYAAKANGVLRVTHADIATTSPGGISLTPRGSLVRPVMGDNVTASSFEIKFYDAANTLMTVPTTDQKVAIQRSVSERKVNPESFTAIINVSGDDYDALVEADGPLSYWPLGDTVGAGTAAAVVGAPTGTISAGVTMGVTGLLSADPRTAAQFDGTVNGKIVFPSPALTGTPFTLEIWFKRTAMGSVGGTTFSSVMGWTSSAGTRRLLLKDDSSFLISAGGANLTTPANAAGDNVVHHLVFTWDLLTQRLYVDGQLVASGNTAGPSIVQPLILGGYDNPITNYAFVGQKARFALYNKALTLNQVQAHYATGAGVVLTVDRAVGSQITFVGVFDTNAPPVTPPPDQPLPTATPLPNNDLGGAVAGNVHLDTYRATMGAVGAWIKRALPMDVPGRNAVLLNGHTIGPTTYALATSDNWRASLCDLLGFDKNTSPSALTPTLTTPTQSGSATPVWLAPSLRMYVVPDDQPLRPFIDQDSSVSGWAGEINAIVTAMGGWPLPADARPDPSPDRYAYFFQPSRDRMINVYDFHGSVPATTMMSLTATPSAGAFGLKFYYRDNALAATTTYFLQTLIAYNATAAQVASAINGAKTAGNATFGVSGGATRPGSYYGSCIVTGGPLNVAPITVTFPSVDPLQPVAFVITDFFINAGTVEFSYTNAGAYDRGRLAAITTPSVDNHIPLGVSGWSGSYSQKLDNSGMVWMDSRWGPTATGIDQSVLIPSFEEYQTALDNGTSLGHVIAFRIGNCMGAPFNKVFPANRGDGTFTRADGSMITEGARFAIPPDQSLAGVIPEFLPIARTLQEYGAVIYDKTGQGSEFVFRNNGFADTTIPNAWLDLLPLYKTAFDAPARYMRSLPWHKMQIIAPSFSA